MSGDLTTHMDSVGTDPGTAADARAYLTRTGNADLLDVLGLIVEVPKLCPGCGKPLPRTGNCRRYRLCQTDGDATRGRRPQPPDDETARRIGQQYKDGASLLAIAKLHHMSESTVRRIVVTQGVAIRRSGGSEPREVL